MISVLTIMGVGAWVLHREHRLERSHAQALARMQATLDANSNRPVVAVSELRRQVAALDARLASVAQVGQPEPSDTHQASDSEDPQDIPQVETGADAIRESLDGIFDNDTADSGSQDARYALFAKLEPILPERSEIRSFDCRASLCKLELRHASLDDHHRFAQAALLSPDALTTGAAFSTVLEDTGDGSGVLTVTYLAKDSEPLPQINIMQ